MENPVSGTLSIQDRTFRAVLPPLCLSVLAAAGLTAAAVPLLFPLLGLTGPVRGAAAAVLAYVLFRVLFPLASRRFSSGGTRRIAWTVTGDSLTFDGQTIARDSIRDVYVWPNRDALGHALPGWTVNIETTGRNLLLHVTGPDRSGKQDGDGGQNGQNGNDGQGGNDEKNGPGGEELRNLLRALGYESRFPQN